MLYVQIGIFVEELICCLWNKVFKIQAEEKIYA